MRLSVLILLLLSLWITRDLFRPEFFQSHDALYHVVRLDQFHKSLTTGQFPVRWAPDLLNGLGYPLFVVNYHLPYYLAETFHLLGLSLFSAIKAVFILSLSLSALTSLWLFYSWTKNKTAAILGSIFFILAPYRLANIFERGALGEAVAYIFIPLVFLGLDKLKQGKIHLFILALSGLILSHTVVLLSFTPVFLIYALVFSKANLKLLTLSGLITFGLTAFQMFPVIFERHYLKFDANLLTAYQDHFKSLYQLLRIPAAGVNLGTRFQVGVTHLSVIILSLVLVLKRILLAKQGVSLTEKLIVIVFFLVTFTLSAFLITPASQFLWDNFLPLRLILYPWRFLGVIAFATAALASLTVSSIKLLRLPVFISLLVLVLFTNRHYVKVDKFIPSVFPQEMLAGNATTQNEFDPIWFKPETLTTKPDPLTKLYFPGWPGFPNASGLTSGDNLKFQETPIRALGNWLSLITATLWLISLLRLPIHDRLRYLPHL